MGRQIVKQPNGLYAVWSSVVDNFIWVDCTKQDLIDGFLEDEKVKIINMVEDDLNDLETGYKRSQFQMTYEECLKRKGRR